MGRKKIRIEQIEDFRLRSVTLNKRKKGLIKKAMEISLLTGVNIMMTIFDKENGRIYQYFSDSIETFQEICQLKEIEVKKRSKKDDKETVSVQKLKSEIYTNDHYDYLFNGKVDDDDDNMPRMKPDGYRLREMPGKHPKDLG